MTKKRPFWPFLATFGHFFFDLEGPRDFREGPRGKRRNKAHVRTQGQSERVPEAHEDVQTNLRGSLLCNKSATEQVSDAYIPDKVLKTAYIPNKSTRKYTKPLTSRIKVLKNTQTAYIPNIVCLKKNKIHNKVGKIPPKYDFG